MNRSAFTLIETMLVVLLLALLAAGVTLGVSGPLQAARGSDAANLVKAFDRAARQSAVASGKAVRVELDLAKAAFARFEGGRDPIATMSLPHGFKIDRVKIGSHLTTSGLVKIDVSPNGWSRSYAVRIVGPKFDRWFDFAGLSGAVLEAANESDLPAPPQTPGYDAH